jgi:hypothetical protein
MWNDDDDDYGCEDVLLHPTDSELLAEPEPPEDDPESNEFIPLALGPPVYVGRGVREATREAIRTTGLGTVGYGRGPREENEITVSKNP